MEQRRRAGSTGYVVVLLGVAAFVTGLFLPYYDYGPSGLGSFSLYRMTMVSRGEVLISVGGVLFLFAGVTTVAWVAIGGVRGSGDWTRPALAAVATAWSLTWFGSLLGASLYLGPRLAGYWVLLLGVGAVVVGTILVWVADRADATKDEAPIS